MLENQRKFSLGFFAIDLETILCSARVQVSEGCPSAIWMSMAVYSVHQVNQKGTTKR